MIVEKSKVYKIRKVNASVPTFDFMDFMDFVDFIDYEILPSRHNAKARFAV